MKFRFVFVCVGVFAGAVFPRAGGFLTAREPAGNEATASPIRVLLCTLAFSSRVFFHGFCRLDQPY